MNHKTPTPPRRGGVTTKKEKKAPAFRPPNVKNTPKWPSKPKKHAIFDAQTPIFWTQTLRPSKMKELNKALHRTAHKAPPVTANVRQMEITQ